MRFIETGIINLDLILQGGFSRPSTLLVAGTAGTGKTTFAMQSLFNAAKKDEVCMYVTSMSEPIAMINNFMSKFSFYNISLLGKGTIKYVPLDINIIKKGASAIINEIAKNIENIKPDRIAIDPVNVLSSGLSEKEQRQFYYDLFIGMKSWNSFIILTGEFTEKELMTHVISYLADGIIYISNELEGNQRNRYIDVLKMRGQNFISGKHPCRITKDGFLISRKITYAARISAQKQRISSGIKGLDQMTRGGFIKESSILVSGGSGTGKTVLGTQYIIDGALKNEAGIIVTFEEDPLQICENMLDFGWSIESLEKKNLLRILSPHDIDAYELAIHIGEIIGQMNVKRIMLDGIDGLKKRLPANIELQEYVNLFISFLKSKNVTALYTNETPGLTGPLKVTDLGISMNMDTIVLLRYVEIKSEMRKAISVLKMRGSDHDKEIREFIIGKNGIEVKLPFSEYAGILSGNPTKTPTDAFIEAFATSSRK